MKNMLKIASLIIVLSLYNCMPVKGVDNKDSADAKTTPNQTITAKEMIEKGFKKGTITANKSEGCPHILNIEEYEDNLDPINLEEFFKGDEMPKQVWVKFANLRMASRCDNARPVSILEIDKRSE